MDKGRGELGSERVEKKKLCQDLKMRNIGAETQTKDSELHQLLWKPSCNKWL